MKIHEVTAATTARSKRVGRGIGSGKGKTAGRGTKGQNSRTGGGVRIGFEGGQNPLSKRLPIKRGFTPINNVVVENINLTQAAKYASKGVVSHKELVAAGVVRDIHTPVKLLGTGTLEAALKIKLQFATKSALDILNKAGGSFEEVALPKRAKKPSARNRT